jgi:hypothetical protein
MYVVSIVFQKQNNQGWFEQKLRCAKIEADSAEEALGKAMKDSALKENALSQYTIALRSVLDI